MLTPDRVRQLILRSAVEHNVLPLTSECNAHCVFCSHALDYPGLDVHRLSPADVDLVRQAVSFLSPDRKVIVGESATRIIEGEPLTHPAFFDLMDQVRERLPETPIQLTTNGSLLDEDRVARLAALAPLSVSLSLNSADPETRRRLMRDRHSATAVAAPRLLSAHAVPYEVSAVAIPGVSRIEEVARALACAERHGARRAKVYVAGCSQTMLTKHRWDGSREACGRLYDELEALRQSHRLPITLQPPRFSSLEAEVVGVAPGSRGAAAGIRTGDTVTHVNGERAQSRSHAHELLGHPSASTVDLRRGAEPLRVQVEQDIDAEAGVVFDDDLPALRLATLASTLHGAGGGVLLLTSSPARSLMCDAVNRLAPGLEVTVAAAGSGLFGGTIACAGLLTVEDFVAAGRLAIDHATRPLAVALLPTEAFDERGLDLVGRSYFEVEEALGVTSVLLR